MARRNDNTEHNFKFVTLRLRNPLRRATHITALWVLCGYCSGNLLCSASDIRIWAFEATVFEFDDPAFAAADVRLGDTIRGTFSYDLSIEPDADTPPDYDSYTPRPGYRGVQLAIENPRSETQIEYVPLATLGIEYWIDVWTYDDTTPSDSDASGVTFYQFGTLANPEWRYSDYYYLSFVRPRLSTDFSLPAAYDLNDWEYAWIWLWADSLVRGLTAQIHTINPVTPGDYDVDGDVDAQDYTAWRSEFGTSGYSDADGNRDSRIDSADYVIWRDRFDTTSAISILAPEPANLILGWLVIVWIALMTRQPRVLSSRPRFETKGEKDIE
jgi:hypothetical protein